MKLEFEVFQCLCEPQVFEINGIRADKLDFVTHNDQDSENAEDYCCGDMRAEGIPVSDDVLKKYDINEKEYKQIVETLESKLSFGCCGWCS